MTIRELFNLLRADLIRLTLPIGDELVIKPRWSKLLNPRFTPILMLRLARYFYLSKWLRFLSPIFTWCNVLLFGIEVTPRCEIGPGLMLPHTHGTVIGASRVGCNATIFQGVTLGAKFADLVFDAAQRPTLGDNVIVGAGAKVLGGIVIGNDAKVGANAVVLHSVPAYAVALGIPAKLVK